MPKTKKTSEWVQELQTSATATLMLKEAGLTWEMVINSWNSLEEYLALFSQKNTAKKTTACIKCGRVFTMPPGFVGSILCEGCDSFMNQTKAKKTSWEEEFDKQFNIDGDGCGMVQTYPEEVKAFIRQVRQEAIKKAIEAVEKAEPIKRGKWVMHPDWISRTELIATLKQKGNK